VPLTTWYTGPAGALNEIQQHRIFTEQRSQVVLVDPPDGDGCAEPLGDPHNGVARPIPPDVVPRRAVGRHDQPRLHPICPHRPATYSATTNSKSANVGLIKRWHENPMRINRRRNTIQLSRSFLGQPNQQVAAARQVTAEGLQLRHHAGGSAGTQLQL
jgi:hypothetical protein